MSRHPARRFLKWIVVWGKQSSFLRAHYSTQHEKNTCMKAFLNKNKFMQPGHEQYMTLCDGKAWQ